MTALIALTVLALLLYYIHLLSLRVDLGLVSLLAVQLYNITFGMNSGMLGGANLSPLDVVSICLLIAGTIRSVQRLKRINVAMLLALGYAALLAFSIVRGVPTNGFFTAMNESRAFVGKLLCMLYFLTAPTDEQSLRRYTYIYLYFGAALCVVTVLAAAGLPVGVTTLSFLAGVDVASDGRYLPASGAQAIAVCGLLSLALLRYRQGGLKCRLLLLMYLFFAVYLRHRTVWVMLLAGMVMMLPLDGKLFRSLLPYALAASALIAGIAIYGSTIRGVANSDQFSEAATDEGTWIWRVNGWKELLMDNEQNALTVAVGKSMGSGYWRVDPITHGTLNMSPHSEYMIEYLRVGTIGAILFLIFALRPIVRLWKLTRIDARMVYPSTSVWALVVVMILFGGITYPIDMHLCALLGIANATISGLNTSAEGGAPQELEEWDLAGAPGTAA